jgi:hypothetical protein
MIVDHAWRPPATKTAHAAEAIADRPCEYMGCGRPRAEHERSVSLTSSRWRAP